MIVAAYQVASTYAIFEESVTAKTGEDLAAWKIKINNTTMGKNVNSFPISSINWSNTNHVISGKVAPGMSGYFQIDIDPSETEVDVRYDITFDFSEFVNEEFTVDSITELVDGTLIQTAENTYTDTITLGEIENNKIHQIRVNLIWNNNDENSEIDSQLGSVPNNQLDITVTVNISQYTGETITQYVAPTP